MESSSGYVRCDGNGLNAEADMRVCLLLSQTLREICKNVKQCYSSKYTFYFGKYCVCVFFIKMLFKLTYSGDIIIILK